MKRFVMLVAMAVLALSIFSVPMAQAQDGGYAPENTGRVRVIHASPDAPAIRIFVDDRPVFRYLSFGDMSFYMPLAAGHHTIKVTPADAYQVEVISHDIDVAQDTDYTVAIVGLAANSEALVLTDDNTPPEAGKAKVRFIHVSPDAPAVDVAVKDGDVLASSVAFKSASNYITVDANRYTLEIRSAGSSDVVLDVPWATLPSGSTSTVLVMGLANGQPPLWAKLRLDSRMHSGPGQGPGYGYGYCCQQPPVYHQPPCCRNYASPPQSYYQPYYQPYYGQPHYYGRPNYNYGTYSYYGGWYYNHYPKYW
ncbi:MAG: DUF4397 domain-containing protein [Anaerolineae bacterium]|nr:DUF4397 domain-containing protein [Anaerolineae bacterium]